MKNLLYTIGLVLISHQVLAQLVDIRYFMRIDRLEHFETASCTEIGTEEYTGFAGFNDNINNNVQWSQCQQANVAGNAVYGQNASIGNRTNNAYSVNIFLHGWEDDRNPRCTYNAPAFLVTGDDCRTLPTLNQGTLLMRETSFPAGNYADGVDGHGYFGDNNFGVYLDYYWFYVGTGSSINMSCTPQVSRQQDGAIRSHSVSLIAGQSYRFETISGNNTFLILYGPDGFTVEAFDDDGGLGDLSLINYTATTSGTYYIETSEFDINPLTIDADLEFQTTGMVASPMASDVIACEGENVVLSASSNGGTLNWYLTNTSTNTLATGTTFNVGNTLAAGTHFRYVSETNADGCISDRTEVEITINPTPEAPDVSDVAVCPGESAILTASNPTGAGTLATNFNWYDMPSISTIISTGSVYNTPNLNMPPTSYTFYVAGFLNDCQGMPSMVEVTFHQADAPTVSSDTSICSGDNAILMASAMNSTEIRWYANSDLTGFIQSGNSFVSPSLASNTTYYVTASYANGCESMPVPIVVTVNPMAQAPVLQDANFCSNEDAMLTAINVMGTITWYTDAGLTNALGTGSPLNIGMQTSGMYNFFAQVSNGTCVSSVENNAVEIFMAPAAPIVTPVSICEGEQANLSVVSANNVNWYADAALTNLVSVGGTFTTPVLNANTTYWVTISNANCESIANSVLVTVDQNPNAPTAMDITICENESGTLNATGNGGTFYWYSDPTLNNMVATGASFTTPILSSNTTYYVVEINGLCPSNSTAVMVNVSPQISAPIVENAEFCEIDDVLLIASNVMGTVTWYSDAALTNVLGTGSPLNIGMQPVGIFTYYAQSSNAVCTSAASTTTVQVISAPMSPILSDQTICQGEQAILTAMNANIVHWYADAALTNLLFIGSTFTTPVLMANTTYYVTNENDDDCQSSSNSVLVTVVPVASAPSALGDTVCYNQSAILMATANGSGTLAWFTDIGLSNQVGMGTSFTSPALLNNTDYYVAEFNGLCYGDATLVRAIVNSNINILVDLITDVSCNGDNDGAIFVNTSGGNGNYSYSWSNGAITEDLLNVVSGTYILTVTDGIGCNSMLSATIDSPTQLDIVLDNIVDVNCSGESNGSISVTATGGTPAYSYSWSDGTVIVSNSNDLLNQGVGTYTLTVTDNNFCMTTFTADINEGQILSGVINTNNALCYGDNSSASVAVMGGVAPYSYLWSNFDNTNMTTNLAAGVVSVIVSDDNNCTINLFDTIRAPEAPLEIMATNIQNVTCFGGNDGAIFTDVTGGTAPYTIFWTPNVGTGADISNLTAGTYTATITDSNNCTTTTDFEIESPQEIVSTLSVTNPSCFGEETGTILVGNSGGTAPYTYSWNTSPVQTGVVVTNLAGGQSYTVTITDFNGCTSQNMAEVLNPEEFIIDALPTNVTCISDANGSVTVQVQNGNAPFEYQLNGFLQADSIFENLGGGNYIVFVEDNNNCTASVNFTIDDVSGVEAEIEGAGNDLSFQIDQLQIVRGEEVQLNVNILNDVGNQIVGYNWFPSELDPIANPSFFPQDDLIVVVEVLEDVNGSICLLTDSLRINVSQESKTFIPNAFSPNNQGVNNFFEMNILGAENLSVNIYNRWGELIFSNPSQGNGPTDLNDASLIDDSNPRGAWDGKFNGEDVPIGAYAYTVEVTYFDGTTELISGSVTIIR